MMRTVLPPRNTVAAPVVRLSAVSKRYGLGEREVQALRDIDLEVGRGEFVAVMGASGSGKSTLMHLLAGLDAPTSGEVWLGGSRIDGLDDAGLTRVRRERVGFVFQSFNLVPTLDVVGNVLLPFELRRQRPDLQHIDRLLAELGLADRRHHRPRELSGGQQQRVAIARALASDPDLIVADEPTGNLDSRTGRDVLQLLVDVGARHGRSVVMVTHDPAAASRADRVLVLADGRVAARRSGASADALARLVLTAEVRP